MTTTGNQHDSGQHDQQHDDGGMQKKMYLRFAAMILTSMVVMYWVMFVATWRWDHVTFSQSRVFMAITMGGAMGLVMLAWMLNMYKSTKGNLAIVAASLLLFAGGTTLDRSQVTVGDESWMSAMIPHHSLAITRSARADIDDVRVCELAASIIEAQKKEIREMQWLIEDIEKNGEARTAAEAAEREVPEFDVDDLRDCTDG
jgi:FtsH-binding integral membrane protein